jgi:archaeoflavoprotein AfpA
MRKVTEINQDKKKKIAWGITGSGDRIRPTFEAMKKINEEFGDRVDIRVYVSKAGDQVVKYYKLSHDLEEAFDKVWVEINANAPFLAGQLQAGKFEFLLIAPATSNTVAKISMGLGDSLLSNSAIMGLKASVPLYIMPSDLVEGFILTRLPNGKDLKLRIRKEDVEHTQKLSRMDNVFILEKPEDIRSVFKKHFT